MYIILKCAKLIILKLNSIYQLPFGEMYMFDICTAVENDYNNNNNNNNNDNNFI